MMYLRYLMVLFRWCVAPEVLVMITFANFRISGGRRDGSRAQGAKAGEKGRESR